MTSPIVLLERAWRRTVVYPFLRVVIRNRHVQLPIDLMGVGSILILRYDKIGDMIVTLPIFHILKGRNPHVKIGVLASESNVEIVRENNVVDVCFVLHRNPFKLLRELNRIRKARYDIVLNFIFNRMTSGGLICNLFCRRAIKIGQGQEKYRFYFNELLSLPRGTTHMFEMLVDYLGRVFGIQPSEQEKIIRLPIGPPEIARVDRFLASQGLSRRSKKLVDSTSYIVLNVSARQMNKRLTTSQAQEIALFLVNDVNAKTIVISAPEDKARVKEIIAGVSRSQCVHFPELGDAGLFEIASLVEGAVCVITPDTAVVHIASATSTPVLGILTPLQVNREWLPYGVPYELITAQEGQPVRAIPTDTLLKGVKKFLEHISAHSVPNEYS